MKKLKDFNAEETGEEWLRELYKVVAQRRNAMFRMITESVRLLLFGNVGGAGLVMGLLGTTGGDEPAGYHWISLVTLCIFAIGTIASALTMILVTAVSINEAHGAERGLREFLSGKLSRSQVLFTVEGRVFRLADFATAAGGVSGFAFMFGGMGAILLIILYF